MYDETDHDKTHIVRDGLSQLLYFSYVDRD